jgi:hypothetical protein
MTALGETLPAAIFQLPKMPAVPPMRMAPTPPAQPATLPPDPGERLAALFDPKTLHLVTTSEDEDAGVRVGVGLVHGQCAVAFACDPRVQGGAMGSAGCAAIVTAYSEAMSLREPIVGIRVAPGLPRGWTACTRWAVCLPQ